MIIYVSNAPTLIDMLLNKLLSVFFFSEAYAPGQVRVRSTADGRHWETVRATLWFLGG